MTAEKQSRDVLQRERGQGPDTDLKVTHVGPPGHIQVCFTDPLESSPASPVDK